MIWFDHPPALGDALEMTLFAAGIGFVLALVTCALALPAFARMQFRQHAYEDAPRTHQGKTGTPTMGGICFIIALLPLLLFLRVPFMGELFFVVAACALIGFIDDFLAIRLGRNMGLRARTKYLATALIAAVFLNRLSSSYGMFPRDVIFRTATFGLHVPHWLWMLLAIIAITGTIHAVNLTDGLDGLATGTMIPPLLVLALLGYQFVLPAAAQVALMGIGACIAFLIYNRHPARMFMGDTGSLALGALLSAVAILSGEMLLLIVLGAVFVAEALSVIVQVAYFKYSGGKRVFRMSPLHHHFELSGWPETLVTARFWIASIIVSSAGLAIVR